MSRLKNHNNNLVTRRSKIIEQEEELDVNIYEQSAKLSKDPFLLSIGGD